LRIVIVFAAVVIFALPAPAPAQIAEDTGLLTANLGWALSKNGTTGNNINGSALNFTYDRFDVDERLTLGINFSVLYLQDEVSDTMGNTRSVNIRSVPVYLSGKYWIGPPQGKWFGYFGLGIGVQLSTEEVSTTGSNPDYTRDQRSGLALAVPLGVTFFVSDNVLINAIYQLNVMSGSYFDNRVAHLFALGIGFRVGGPAVRAG
jgi:outer membrane protein W